MKHYNMCELNIILSLKWKYFMVIWKNVLMLYKWKILKFINLQPGEILITLSTDIAWSPYFPILGGVVTEIGGLISHGKIIYPFNVLHIEVTL